MDNETKPLKPPMATKFDRESSRMPKPDGFYWQRWRGGHLIEAGDLLADGTAQHERTKVSKGEAVDRGLSPEDADRIGQYLRNIACPNG